MQHQELGGTRRTEEHNNGVRGVHQNTKRTKNQDMGTPTGGYVSGGTFQHTVMKNMQNLIVVDQNYYPGNVDWPNQVHILCHQLLIHIYCAICAYICSR